MSRSAGPIMVRRELVFPSPDPVRSHSVGPRGTNPGKHIKPHGITADDKKKCAEFCVFT